MSIGSSLGMQPNYQHNLTNFDIEMDQYNNEHNPQLHVETSVSLHDPHYCEFLLKGEKSITKNRSYDQALSETSEMCYSSRKPFEKISDISETQYQCSKKHLNKPGELQEENINSNTATFRDQKQNLEDSQAKTEVLKDEIEELNSEIRNLQEKINSAIKKKKQTSN